MLSIPLERFRTLLTDRRFVLGLFILLAVFAALKQYFTGSYNNYLIYKYTFWHTLQGLNLYGNYPAEHLDSNHYGPVFAVVMAPFALLPDVLGSLLWNVANALVLVAGFYSLPLSIEKKSIIALICAHEAFGALLSFQFNIGLTGLIMLSFSYIIKEKEVRSALFIAIGTLIKLYGIVGLAFFFFSRHKVWLIGGGLLSLLTLFVLPMILHSLGLTVQSYVDWYNSLVLKNSHNDVPGSMQNISVMGFFRRTTGITSIPNGAFMLGGLVLFGLPYLRISQFKYTAFRLMLLSSTLIFTVIFSSGSESPTYIIAFAGVAIWFMIQPRPKKGWVIFLFVFAFLLTSMSPSDLFPKFIREEYVKPYALKALPCILVWLAIIYQMLRDDFKKYTATPL